MTESNYIRATDQNAPLIITAVGDIMLGRSFREGMFSSAESLLDKSVLELLHGDIVTGNLECLLTQSKSRNQFSHSHFSTKSTFARSMLKRFNVLSLANNHVFDFDDQGISDTLENLLEMGVDYVGVGKTEEESLTPVIIKQKGRSVAVFGLSTAVNITSGPSRFVVAQPSRMAYKKIASAAQSGHFVVVHLHAGGGDVPYPSPEIRILHGKILSAGAHLILGHHPHCSQGWITNGRVANFYSLGDFIFDRFESGRDTSLLVRAIIEEELTLDVLPVCRRPDFIVGLPDENIRSELLNKLSTLNVALANGASDQLYINATLSLTDAQLSSLLRDFRLGGPTAVFKRIRRAGPHRVIRFLRSLLIRIFY